MREGLSCLRDRLVGVIDALARFAAQYRDLADAWLHALPAGPADHGRQTGLPLVSTISSSTWQSSSTASTTLRFRGARARPARRPVFWPCSAAITTRSASSIELVARKMGFDARLSRDRADLHAQDRQPGARRAVRHRPDAPTRWAPICGCWPIARRSTSRSRRSRSAPRRWRTSATRCGANACAGSGRFLISLADERRPDGGDAMAGAHAGRQRQSPADAAASVPGGRRPCCGSA